jgi:antitoxin component YwqK of YwqJK toxin-antitoxin module
MEDVRGTASDQSVRRPFGDRPARVRAGRWLALGCALVAVTLPAEVAAQPAAAAKGATPAGAGEPSVPRPAPFAKVEGFTPALLDWSAAMAPNERTAALAAGHALLTGPLGGSIRELARRLTKIGGRTEGIAVDASAEGEDSDLLSVGPAALGIVRDPALASVLAAPRLVGGLPLRAESVSSEVTDTPWIDGRPDRVCAQILASAHGDFTLDMGGFERQSAAVGLAPWLDESLEDIERDADVYAASRETLDTAALQPAEAPSAPRGSEATASGTEADYAASVAALPVSAEDEDPADGAARAVLRALEPTVKTLASQCRSAGRKVVVARGGGVGPRVLFACKNDVGQNVGPAILAESGDGEALASVTFTSGTGDAGAVAAAVRFDLWDESVRMLTMRRDEPYGVEIAYRFSGEPVALEVVGAARPAAPKVASAEFHPNGRLQSFTEMDGGRLVQRRQWYENGSMAAVDRFDAAGALAEHREWFSNGAMAEELKLAGGKLVGTRRWWHRNGKLAGEHPLRDGEPDGAVTMWYPNGKVGVTARYEAGKPTGEIAYFYESGAPLAKATYKAGKRDGAFTSFAPNGHRLAAHGYADGRPSGAWSDFDLAGKPLREVAFASNGAKHGVGVLHWPGGGKMLEAPFVQGQLEGDLKVYFPGGALASVCSFSRSELREVTAYQENGAVSLHGVVESARNSVVHVTFNRADGRSMLACDRSDERVACTAFDAAGRTIAWPDQAALATRLTAALAKGAPADGGALAWHPERCGGATRQFALDEIIGADVGSTRVTVRYDVLAECRDQRVASELACDVEVRADGVVTRDCEALRAADATTLLAAQTKAPNG